MRIENSEPDGREWEVVERPDAVAVVALTTGNDLLLVRQWRQPVRVHTLELPAGIVDPGESVEAAACRELLEETGYRAAAVRAVATFYSSPGFTDERIHLLLATECVPDVSGKLDVATDVVKLSRPDIVKIVDAPSTAPIDGKTLVGLIWWLRHTASADL